MAFARMMGALAGIAILLSTLALGIFASSAPYTLKEFNRDLSNDPVVAARNAVQTNNRHYLYSLNLSAVPLFLIDQVLDIALNDDFPATTIAQALEAGTILKLSTWKRLTQTQLAHQTSTGASLRDYSPDLSLLNAAARDGSIQDNAGLDLTERILTVPTPGATSTTEHGTVAISSLQQAEISYQTLFVKGDRLEQAGFIKRNLSIALAENLELWIPRHSLREPLYPETGSTPGEERVASLHNASNIRLSDDGTLSADEADLAEVFFPIQPSNPGHSKEILQRHVKINGHGPLKLFKAKNLRIHIDGMGLEFESTVLPHATVFEAGLGRQFSYLSVEAQSVSNLHAEFSLPVLFMESAKHLFAPPLHIGELHNGNISLEGGLSISLENDSAIILSGFANPVNYHTTSLTNQLRADPAANLEGPLTLTIQGAMLTFTEEGLVETINAGNSTMVTISPEGGFSCANLRPLSSFTYTPELLENSISIAAFSKPHTVCTIADLGTNRQSCTTDCTLLNLVDSTITSHGPVDIQAPLDPFPRSLFTAYESATWRAILDKNFDTITQLEILDNTPVSIASTNAFRIADQSGHRLLTLSRELEAKNVVRQKISAIQSKYIPLLQVAPTYALQHTTTGKGLYIYILFPNNPQIQELVKLADKRLES